MTEALEQWIASHRGDLEAYLRRHAGDLLQRENESDLLQSVCREVLADWRAGDFRYQGEAAFKQWFYQATLLKIRERRRYWRAEKRDVARAEPVYCLSSTSGNARELAFLESVATPSGVVARREEIGLVEQAFAQLDPSWRKLIYMAHVEGLAHREIAARLGVSEAHSRMLLSRALRRLATVYKGLAPRPEA